MGRSWRRAGYGCSPDIASTAHAPAVGAGEERRRRGRDGGPAEAYGIPCEGAGRVGVPEKRAGILYRRRGRGGGCRQKRMGTPAKARAGWSRWQKSVEILAGEGEAGVKAAGKERAAPTCRGGAGPGGELPEKGSREEDRPVSAPARLPAAGAGISSVEEADRANNVRRMSRTCDIISCFHNTWASENHSLHLFRLIGRNVCDREVVRTCN